MKKLLSMFIVFALVISSVTVFASSASDTAKTTVEEIKTITFSDVDANASSGVAIYKLVNAGILNGYEDGTFRPNNPLTRAELCKIVNLVFKYTEAEELTFSDVKKEDWFYNYVAIAKKAGYITGHADGTFKGNDYLTREQTCAIITRVASLYDLSMTETITDTVSEWAVSYVNKVVANKLMPLEEGGKFRATENITRAELVSVVSNFVVEEQKPAEGTTVAQYTVTFNTNGGSAIAAVKIESGKNVTKPTNPTKTGHTFAGWYSDSGLTKTFDFNTKITADVTLYAKWNKGSAVGGGGGGGSSGGGSSKPSKPVIDKEKQDEVVTTIESLVKSINNKITSFSAKELEILEIVLDVMDSVLKDAEKKAVYNGDYIIDNYSDDIDKAGGLYNAMTDEEKSQFKTTLVTNLGKGDAETLLKVMFGMTLEDAKDKIDK